jgi:hypothetical protein
MAVGSKAHGTTPFDYVAEFFFVLGFVYGVHFGATVLCRIDDAIQWIKESLDFCE